MNENGMKKCLLMLVVARFGFGGLFHLPFLAFCCSSLHILAFEIEPVLSQKPKQANAFGCSFWCFAGTKNENEQQTAKKSEWKPGLQVPFIFGVRKKN